MEEGKEEEERAPRGRDTNATVTSGEMWTKRSL